MSDLVLEGCSPQPLLSYLKALGTMRIVGEQADPDARGFWKDGTAVLRTDLSRASLMDFLLDRYSPSPVVAPWNGGSGFHPKDNHSGIESIRRSQGDRLEAYRKAIALSERILLQLGIRGAPKKEEKLALLEALRRELSDEALPWLDAVFCLREDQAFYAPVLGTGGNDGRLEFTNNHMQRLSVILDLGPKPQPLRRAWLERALFGTPGTTLVEGAIGQFHPVGSGGANATEGFEAPASLVNPWDYVLMMEGILFLSGSVSRRLGQLRGRSAFPFTVEATAAGWATIAPDEEPQGRGELWLPIWERPASVREMRQLFSEARVQVGRRQAQGGLDMARAAILYGVDRGVTMFERYGFFRRLGKAYFAVALGPVAVVPRPEGDALTDLDDWRAQLRKYVRGKTGTPGFGSALRNLETAIFDYCLKGGTGLFRGVLESAGATEREAAALARPSDVASRPFQRLSPPWSMRADDGSVEFHLAAGLASLHDPRMGGIRIHMEPVQWRGSHYSWGERTGTISWFHRDLVTNLFATLQRRMIESEIRGEGLVRPLHAIGACGLTDIHAFLSGEVQEASIERVLWGLLCLRSPPQPKVVERAVPPLLSRAYALLKLLFLPFPLKWGESPVLLPPSSEVLRLLGRGDAGGACRVAIRILRGKGLEVRAPGPSTKSSLSLFEVSPRESARLAASLLFPIGPTAATALARLVLHPAVEGRPP
jgi:CRISPR-associated protein Csx17